MKVSSSVVEGSDLNLLFGLFEYFDNFSCNPEIYTSKFHCYPVNRSYVAMVMAKKKGAKAKKKKGKKK